jgi:hypothetical protein
LANGFPVTVEVLPVPVEVDFAVVLAFAVDVVDFAVVVAPLPVPGRHWE